MFVPDKEPDTNLVVDLEGCHVPNNPSPGFVLSFPLVDRLV